MGMMHGITTAVGKALRPVHAGVEKLAIGDTRLLTRARLAVTSPAFADGAALPEQYSADGDGVSPPIHIDNVPPRARELVLLCEDPDAPLPRPFVHWVLYGLGPDVRDVPPSLPTEARGGGPFLQGRNTTRKAGFTPAAPPPGHGPHHYHFQAFALDRVIDPGELPSRDDVVDAMAGHVIAAGELVATYERR